jgi:hypothetical protein
VFSCCAVECKTIRTEPAISHSFKWKSNCSRFRSIGKPTLSLIPPNEIHCPLSSCKNPSGY